MGTFSRSTVISFFKPVFFSHNWNERFPYKHVTLKTKGILFSLFLITGPCIHYSEWRSEYFRVYLKVLSGHSVSLSHQKDPLY